ncbi:hypothetical protein L211DRAFT_833773 [Terfezia boudieri ATCC MYA-4762]|uniref:Uncharacterized protein n=1 Tax=Terfezia boudieri ATCC MYA-4762 TaxID=1051890 RepID=A0A3N4M4C5_9PEZI|nr:hypothetical protein L211DRAFT_833773 [Terfezia boudieri ATCC MYA-4762]
MNAIPSAIHAGFSRLTSPLHIDINQQVISLPTLDFSRLEPVSGKTLQFHLLALPAQLDEYFKNVAEELKKHMENIVSKVQEIDWTDKQSIMNGLQPILDFLKPMFEYVKAHPWILIPLIIPALELFIGVLGFGAEGVVAGSIAAALQSAIGNVSKKSLFAFLQSVGAGGWGLVALQQTNMLVTIAVIIAAIGELLISHGIMEPDAVKNAMEGVWNKVVNKFDPPTNTDSPTQTDLLTQTYPPVSSVASQVMVLNLDSNVVRYGLLAWVLMYGAVCVGEGGVF